MIRIENSHLHIAAKSHPGMRGKNNEDRFAVSAFHLSQDQPTPAVFAVLSDGIGGHRAGEVAAEMAVDTISQIVAESDGAQPVHTLRNAIGSASQVIREQAERDAQLTGMGATCACAWVIANRLYAAWVGDSRIYLVRRRAIYQLTTDHTWVQEALEAGTITPEQARNHPNAHIIRRHLGSSQPVEPDFRLRLNATESEPPSDANQGMKLLPGDQLILCSDGLTDLVSQAELLYEVEAHSQEKAIDRLVSLANQRGGHDNITVISLRLPLEDTQRLPLAGKSPLSNWRSTCLVIGLLVILAASILGGLYLYSKRSVVQPTVTATLAAPLPTSTFSFPSPSPTQATPLPPTASPTFIVSPSLTPISATLTPWPTNTQAP